jgi:hypothetical protein
MKARRAERHLLREEENLMNRVMAIVFVVALAPVAARADLVSVVAEGTVVFDAMSGAPLSAVTVGDMATMPFQVDSNVFVEGVPGDTRGYEIINPTFMLAFDTPVSVGLLSPFPAGQTPYFTLVDGFPVYDGFFVSTSPVSLGGVPLSQTPLQANLDLGYVGTTLSSLNILDALGTYDFTGLTRFGLTLWQSFPDDVRMEIEFARLTITPEPTALALLAMLALLAARRRG